MGQSLELSGHAFRLRPIAVEDAEFVVELRGKSSERAAYIPSLSPDIQLQERWLREFVERGADHYWVIERRDNGEREGLISLYNIDRAEGSAEWGRWVLRPRSLAAIESALLVYRVAFEHLHLKMVYCLTVAENGHVVSFHDSCGLARGETLKARYALHDGVHDAIRQVCTDANWPFVRDRLDQQAKRIAQHLSRRP